MKNLIKHLLLLTVIFPVIILLSSVFSEKAIGQNTPQCDSFGPDLSCHALGNISFGCRDSAKPTMCLSKTNFFGADHVNGQDVVCCKVPPTPIPCSAFTNCSACLDLEDNTTCGWNGSSCQAGTSSCPAGFSSWFWTSCSANVCAPTPTPVPPTPTPTI